MPATSSALGRSISPGTQRRSRRQRPIRMTRVTDWERVVVDRRLNDGSEACWTSRGRQDCPSRLHQQRRAVGVSVSPILEPVAPQLIRRNLANACGDARREHSQFDPS